MWNVKGTAALLTVAAIVGGSILLVGKIAAAADADTGQSRLKMVEQLSYAFPGKVDIFMSGREIDQKQPSFAGARMTSVIEGPTMTYYQVTLADGTVMLVNPSQVAAIRQVK